MTRRRATTSYLQAFLYASVFFMLASCASAQYTLKTLYAFGFSDDGFSPNGGLVTDGAGNLYGTTADGGNRGSGYCLLSKEPNCGTVFELTPTSDGGWTETILYTFAGFDDGATPHAGVIFGANGNLYGTTSDGGGRTTECPYVCGTVFQLVPGSNGWSESLIHSFGGTPDGFDPYSSLALGGDGNLYGTTRLGGRYGGGTVFELIKSSSDTWTEKILHSFSGPDGGDPEAGLVFDKYGNLYGTTLTGGKYNFGTVFALVREGGGWTARPLHDFTGGSDGGWPISSLTFDGAGNLYGTAYLGGITSDCISQYSSWKGCGVVFELAPTTSGPWNETVLYSFVGGNDARNPIGEVIFDSEGSLYGVSVQGGSATNCYDDGCGTVFKLSPGMSGWTESVIQNFNAGNNGEGPSGNLLMDGSGNLYGTTQLYPSVSCCGSVFELTPESKK
jgi:uncharacterized repeat protein (TIGR03803 family)